MSNYIYSFSMIAPSADTPAINAVGEALGHGTPSLSVPLSPDGTEPATHYGGHAVVTQEFIDTLTSGSQGDIPPELEAAGHTGEQVANILANLETLVYPDKQNPALQNFLELAGTLGLQRIQQE